MVVLGFRFFSRVLRCDGVVRQKKRAGDHRLGKRRLNKKENSFCLHLMIMSTTMKSITSI